MDQSEETQRQISSCLLDLSNKIERLIVSHTELAENITKLKEAVYNPDEGIYARIRELEREVVKNGEVRMAKVEDTVRGIKKLQWMVIGTGVSAVVAVLFKALSL
tara:strand:+ start:295 stop:609 length:315 start_codon:yes stop_codon:yes gene_type:complete